MKNSIFKSGMLVICTDNENIETVVSKDRAYQVRAVSHRGALLSLNGVAVTLASSRFAPATSVGSTPVEMANASNQ